MQKKTLKYLVVGDSGVGKTALLVRYCEESFSSEYLSTIGVDFKIKRIQVNGQPLTLNIWDTAGQQRFRNITKSFYKGAHGILLTYSVTDPASFKHIQNWVDQIQEAGNNNVNMILVASKIDLQNERKVQKRQGEQLAEKYNLKLVETSAKTDSNISLAFDTLTRQVLQRLEKQEDKQEEFTLKKTKQKNKDCC